MNANEPLRILIVDDELPARNRMRELLEDCRGEVPNVMVGEAANGLAALDAVATEKPDVVLVDIHMPGMSGIELAGHLQVLDSPPAVVFVTAHDQYAVDAFEVNAIDYLLKPVRAARLVVALKKIGSGGGRPGRDVLAKLDDQPRRHFSVAERGKVQLVPVNDVLYLKADLKYVVVKTSEREYLIEESLSRMEEEFGDVFMRIHRSCLVARRMIRGFERITSGADQTGEGEGWAVVLEGSPEKLAVSRRQWPQVKALIKS